MKNLYFTLLCLLAFGLTGTAQKTPFSVSLGDLRARDIGPAVMSGRVSALAAIDRKPETMYVGAANGGVWKTISAGASFRPVFDDFPQSIGAIAIDQAHPDTIWVGTGEPWVRNSVSVGRGLYVSTNGGGTWTAKGLQNSERISRMAIHPGNPSTLFVGVQGHLWGPNEERGVYKTTDFGKTWERILYIDENTGCADLAMDPDNPDVLYAAMWEHRRSPDFFQSGGPGSALYKSEDGGKTWNKIHNGLPEGQYGRIGIAIAPSDANRIYICLESEEGENSGIYRSDNAGGEWRLINSDFNSKIRPFYFSRLVVGPKDPDKLYKCGLNLTISDDGGETFRSVGSGVHSDIHDVWINPQNTNHIVVGTDGGVYRSLDGGYLFEMFMNLPISQFYQISIDNEEPYNIYGGLQDNGSWYGPSRAGGGIKNSDWKFTNGGDGFYSFRHPTDPDVIYAESQGGRLVRHNKKLGLTKNISPLAKEGEPDFRYNWNAPVSLSPNNPERLYFGAQFLFMSEDRGDSWSRISPDLTTNDPQRQRQKKSGGFTIDNSTAENNTTIYAIAESSLDERLIWAGTDDGYLQVTTDGGENWTNVTPNIPGLPPGLWCTWVEPGHANKGTAYVTFDGHRSGDITPYVYKTTDLGKTWTSVVTKPVQGYAHCILEDPILQDLLFLGTEFGLFISLDGGLSWKHFTNNIPQTGVRAMRIHPREHDLVIGTHGRGIYIIDDIDLLRLLRPEIANNPMHFFDRGPSILPLPQTGSWFGGAGNYSGENPKEVATIAYYMKKRHVFGKMSLEVYDSEGSFIKSLPAGKNAGLNIVELPIRLKRPKAAPTKNRMALFGSIITPTLDEGDYIVKVKKGKETFETTLSLRANPKLPFSVADRKLFTNTLKSLYDMTNELGYMYYAMKDMHTQADERAEKMSKKKDRIALEEFAAAVESFKDGLVALEGDMYVDESANIREDISTLYLDISFYPGPPSSGQVNKTRMLEERMKKVEKKFVGFKAQMEELNAKLQKSGLSAITINSLSEYLDE